MGIRNESPEIEFKCLFRKFFGAGEDAKGYYRSFFIFCHIKRNFDCKKISKKLLLGSENLIEFYEKL